MYKDDKIRPYSEENITRLLQVMRQLRHPETGCQWDLEQSFASLSKYTIEEAYEVADAALNGQTEEVKEELGDLLLQVVFYSQIANEENKFDFWDVVKVVTEKMIRRHPHIFSERKEYKTSEQQKENWEIIKDLENQEKDIGNLALLSGVGKNLPSLLKSKKIQEKVSRVGFDWENTDEVIDKVNEEFKELIDAINRKDNLNSEEEMGDLLFTLVNLGRHINVDCDTALRKANNKFSERFTLLEQQMLKENKKLSPNNKLDMEKGWLKVKRLNSRKDGKTNTTDNRS